MSLIKMGRKGVSVERRLREFSGCGLVKSSEGTLFCSHCCVNVNFSRKSTIINHLNSAGHFRLTGQTADNIETSLTDSVHKQEISLGSGSPSISTTRKTVSVERRLREFPDCGFINSEGVLFCTWCSTDVDFIRKSTIINHLNSAGHVRVTAPTADVELKQEVILDSSSIDRTQKTISVERRLLEFPDCGFINSEGILFCTWCCTAVDFFNRSIIVNHLNSADHINRKDITSEQKPQVPLSLTSTNTKLNATSIKTSTIINRVKSTGHSKRKAIINLQKLHGSSKLSSIIRRRRAISVERRLREFPDCGFINSEGILFCTWCCAEVDFFKRSVIVNHLKSIGHVNRKAMVFSVLDEELLQDEIFFLKSCIFCAKDCSRCPKTIWNDEEKKTVLKLVFSTKSTGGFRSFFWQLLLGSSANKMMESSFGIEALWKSNTDKRADNEDNDGSEQDATTVQVLPVCTACLKAVVIIQQLHSDLERIQMLMVDEISKIQKNVKVSNVPIPEPDEDKRQEAQFEVLTQIRQKICSQSENAIKIPLVFLDRLHSDSIKPPDVNINNIQVKEEPVDVVQNLEMSPPYDEMDNWSPMQSDLCASNNDNDDDSGNDEDYTIESPVKRRRGRSPKKNSKKRRVQKSRKDDSGQKHSREISSGTSTQTVETSLSVVSSFQPNNNDISVKPKKSCRLIVRKNIWKRKSTAGAPVSTKRHFRTIYRCEICSKTYYMRTVFLKHKRAHKDDDFNKKLESSKNALSDESKNCCVCKQDIPQSDYYEHLLSHEEEVGSKINNSEVKFACSHKDCIRKFNIEENLKIHMEIDHDEISSTACHQSVKKCDVCQVCYNTSSDLLEHFNKVHEKQSHCLYYCPVCAHCYSQSENLISHMHSHRTKDQRDQQICFICKATSASRNELLIHFEQAHDLTTKGECDICKEKFDDIYVYYLHLKTVHKRQERFVCRFCGKICYFASSFMRHVNVHQKIEKPEIRCEICNNAFRNEDRLFFHRVNFHSAPKIPCKVCNREYSTPSLLLAHMKYHNNRNFRCKVCDKSFATRGNLECHRFVHVNERPFTCEFCGFACKTKYSLKHHHGTHEKKFECNICGRKFSRIHALKVHSKMHTDETLVCPYCGCEFHSQKSWKRHVKTYHESENPLPLSRPHKKRSALLRWKDSEGNVYHAKSTNENNFKIQTQVEMEDETSQEQVVYEETSSTINSFDSYPGKADGADANNVQYL